MFRVEVTLYPFGQKMTNTVEVESMDKVYESIDGFLALHRSGSHVDVELRITLP